MLQSTMLRALRPSGLSIQRQCQQRGTKQHPHQQRRRRGQSHHGAAEQALQPDQRMLARWTASGPVGYRFGSGALCHPAASAECRQRQHRGQRSETKASGDLLSQTICGRRPAIGARRDLIQLDVDAAEFSRRVLRLRTHRRLRAVGSSSATTIGARNPPSANSSRRSATEARRSRLCQVASTGPACAASQAASAGSGCAWKRDCSCASSEAAPGRRPLPHRCRPALTIRCPAAAPAGQK